MRIRPSSTSSVGASKLALPSARRSGQVSSARAGARAVGRSHEKRRRDGSIASVDSKLKSVFTTPSNGQKSLLRRGAAAAMYRLGADLHSTGEKDLKHTF